MKNNQPRKSSTKLIKWLLEKVIYRHSEFEKKQTFNFQKPYSEADQTLRIMQYIDVLGRVAEEFLYCNWNN